MTLDVIVIHETETETKQWILNDVYIPNCLEGRKVIREAISKSFFFIVNSYPTVYFIDEYQQRN